MKVSDYFSSKWLSNTDIPDDLETAVVTIREVAEVQLDEDDGNAATRLALEFDQFDKLLVLNKTNAITIAGMYGNETDDWIGQVIGLFVTDVEYKGKMVLAIRVRSKPPKTAPMRSLRKDAKKVLGKRASVDGPKYVDDGIKKRADRLSSHDDADEREPRRRRVRRERD